MTHTYSRRLFLIGSTAIAITSAFGAMADSSDDTIFQSNGYAIDGYDTVAYFTQEDAVVGNPDFKTDYKGAIWLFASAANRDAFITNPEKYAPQYEGYCAYAAANNSIAKTEPDQWSIVDGKLYLNYNYLIKLRWDVSQDDFITDADKYWPGVRPGIKTGRPL